MAPVGLEERASVSIGALAHEIGKILNTSLCLGSLGLSVPQFDSYVSEVRALHTLLFSKVLQGILKKD